MPDLSELNSAQAVKVAGANTAGDELAFVPAPTIAPVPNVPGLVVRPLPYYPKTFHVFQSAVAIGNNKSMLSLYNASGSAVKLRLREIKILSSQTSAVTGVIADFRLKRFSTLHTVGTDLTPESSDSSDILNASITAKTNATIAGESAADMRRAQWSSDEWGTGTLDTEGSDHAMQLTGEPWYTPRPDQKPITLNAGEGLHIKQVLNSAVGSFDILAVFTEESA